MKAKFVFNCTSGSRAYNLLTPLSDFDSIDVFLQPLKEKLLFPCKPIFNTSFVFDGRVHEETYIEFTEFVRRCIAGDVKFVQVLYSDLSRMFSINYEFFKNNVNFANFIAHLKLFVDRKKFVKNLLSVSNSSLIYAGKNESYKKLAESARCLQIVQEILSSDNFTTFLTGEVRQKIFDIKTGKPDYNDCRNSLLLLHQNLFCAFDDYKPQSSKVDDSLLSLIAGFYAMPVSCETLDI
jgi:hypothetical protein